MIITMKVPDLSELAEPGRLLTVRVTPGAGRNDVSYDGARLVVRVTAIAEGGKANAAVIKLLAKSLGIAKSRLLLRRGQSGRDKLFEIT